jgi:hypothetical protein
VQRRRGPRQRSSGGHCALHENLRFSWSNCSFRPLAGSIQQCVPEIPGAAFRACGRVPPCRGGCGHHPLPGCVAAQSPASGVRRLRERAPARAASAFINETVAGRTVCAGSATASMLKRRWRSGAALPCGAISTLRGTARSATALPRFDHEGFGYHVHRRRLVVASGCIPRVRPKRPLCPDKSIRSANGQLATKA